MLNFFRKLRRNFVRDGNLSGYLKYAIGEITLIVIGILLALQINVWRVNAEEADIRKSYYRQLLEDLEKDSTYISNTLAEIDSFQLRFQRYVKLYERPNLSQEEILNGLYQVPRSSQVISFHSSTLESLKSTGDLKLFPPGIRNLLTQHNRKQQQLSTGAFANGQQQTAMLQPFALQFGKRFFNKRMQEQENMASSFRAEHNLPEMIVALETALLWKANNSGGSKILLQDLAVENDSLIRLIRLAQN